MLLSMVSMSQSFNGSEVISTALFRPVSQISNYIVTGYEFKQYIFMLDVAYNSTAWYHELLNVHV